MRTLVTILFLVCAFLSKGQEIDVFVKSACFTDSVKIQLNAKELKKKNVEEIKIEKVFYKLKDSLSSAISSEKKEIIIQNLEKSKCYFVENFSKIKNKKIREIFLQNWLEIKTLSKEFAKKNNRKTEISLIHFLETSGIKEADDLYLARKVSLEYIEIHKTQEQKHGWGNIRRVGDDEAQKQIEIGIYMLIEVHKRGLGVDMGLRDFDYALKVLLNCVPNGHEEPVKRKWTKIIGEQTKIYL